MDDEVAHRLELDIARDHANRLAAEVEIDQGCGEAAGVHMGEKVAVFQGNERGILLVAVDDGGNQAFAAHGPGGPLALPGTRLGLQQNCFSHGGTPQVISINQMEPSGSILASTGLPPGVTGARGGAYKVSGQRWQGRLDHPLNDRFPSRFSAWRDRPKRRTRRERSSLESRALFAAPA